MIRELTPEEIDRYIPGNVLVINANADSSSIWSLKRYLNDVRLLVDEEPDPEPGQAPKKRAKIDLGKIKALRDGGWPVPKIADEIGCSPATVYNALKKLGDMYPEDPEDEG